MKIAKIITSYFIALLIPVDNKKRNEFQWSNDAIISKAKATKLTTKNAMMISKKSVVNTTPFESNKINKIGKKLRWVCR